LFQAVRDCREQQRDYEKLVEVWSKIKENFPDDWLCSLEILEILEKEKIYVNTAKEITEFLELKAGSTAYTKLIKDGFYLIKHPVTETTVFKS